MHPADSHDLIRVQGARENNGGRIVFEGTPGDLVASARTLTGAHLKAYVS